MRMPFASIALVSAGWIAGGCAGRPPEPAGEPRGVAAQDRPRPAGPDIYVVLEKCEGVRTRESREGGPDLCIWHEIVSLKNTVTQDVIRIEYPVLPYLDSRDELLHRSRPGDALKIALQETRMARERIIDLHASRIDIVRPSDSPPQRP